MTDRRIHIKKVLMAVPVAGLVLAALYPVFANPFVISRENARKSQCISNLKQLGTAINIYFTDYDGMLPSSALRTKSRKWDADGFITYAMYKNAPNGGVTIYQTLQPYMKNPDMMWCPSYPEDKDRPTAWVSYYYKAAVDRSWFDGKGREGDFEAPSDQVIFWENNSRHDNQGSKGVVDGVKLNVSFADGHVSTRTITNSGYTADENPPTPSPKSKMGEPAWFNTSIKNGTRATRTYYDVTKYMDGFKAILLEEQIND